jgi:hypothetical protein
MGAELRTRSTRPGAYDAMAIPSLMNGRKRLPGDREPAAPYVPRDAAPQPLNLGPRNSADEIRTMAREFPSVHRRSGEYRPHPGSTPAKVLDHLRACGGFISQAEICERFDIPRGSITAAFKPALRRGGLVRQVVAGYTGFSLPGWTPPVGQSSRRLPTHAQIIQVTGNVEALKPEHKDRRFCPINLGAHAADGEADLEQMSALYELNLREAEHGLLLGYIAVLQLRRQLFDAVRLFPLPPLTEPPRLADAA